MIIRKSNIEHTDQENRSPNMYLWIEEERKLEHWHKTLTLGEDTRIAYILTCLSMLVRRLFPNFLSMMHEAWIRLHTKNSQRFLLIYSMVATSSSIEHRSYVSTAGYTRILYPQIPKSWTEMWQRIVIHVWFLTGGAWKINIVNDRRELYSLIIRMYSSVFACKV